ncbi:ocs element-binding factor 1 [Phtheirospermum japonicum]|uniref:Ocs element-binding factor 1 n=1 Tax=Phtheirospermum japonicum TaxID=374723 RepID=A0A830C8Z9_9LAMI|nr:ocs element-binding factor 1 [Phtheirospermum japonicum]
MIDGASDLYINFASENNVLRAQVPELTDRLRSLNHMFLTAPEVSWFDIPDIPDKLLEPWQLPCPIQSIPASLICSSTEGFLYYGCLSFLGFCLFRVLIVFVFGPTTVRSLI